MGLWSFVKGAEKKVFGKDEREASALVKEVEDLELDATGLDISVKGD